MQKKGKKKDSLEGRVRKRAKREGKECWKKKKEQEDVGQHMGFRSEDCFFFFFEIASSGRNRCFFYISCVFSDIACCGVPPNLASFLSVP